MPLGDLSVYRPYNRDFSFGFHAFAPFDAPSLLDRIFDGAIYSTARHFGVEETDNGYVLTIELPGFKQSDLDVELENETLSVTAKREGKSYQQSVTVPRGVDSSKVEAKLENGLLQIVLPKSELAKPRKVAIK